MSCQDNSFPEAPDKPYLAKNWMLSVGHSEQESLAENWQLSADS